VPEYLSLFSDPKRVRQRFFDRFLFQISPVYRDLLARNNRALKQKNALLRQEFFSFAKDGVQLETWNRILSETIPCIFHIRKKFLEELNPVLQKVLTEISTTNEKIEINIEAHGVWEQTEAGVREFFNTQREREILARCSLIGNRWYTNDS